MIKLIIAGTRCDDDSSRSPSGASASDAGARLSRSSVRIERKVVHVLAVASAMVPEGAREPQAQLLLSSGERCCTIIS